MHGNPYPRAQAGHWSALVGSWLAPGQSNPWLDLGQSSPNAGTTPGRRLLGPWLALVGPALGWPLACLAKAGANPGWPLVGPWSGLGWALVGPTLGWTLASATQGWYNHWQATGRV